MAKLKSDPITSADLNEYLQGKDDFRLEIAALKSLKKRGLDAQHGGTYEDPVTKLSRQFDLRASIQKGHSFAHLAVECKSLKASFPLLISTLPRTPEEAYHEILLANNRHPTHPKDYLDPHFRSVSIDAPASPYAIAAPCGKSTTQVGRDVNGDFVTGDGEVYAKWSQAISSAFDLVSNAIDDIRKSDKDIAISVILPILVLNEGGLWLARYSEDGDLLGEPQQTDSAEIFIGKQFRVGPRYRASHLHVFTLPKFDRFLNRLLENTHYWDAFFPDPATLFSTQQQ